MSGAMLVGGGVGVFLLRLLVPCEVGTAPWTTSRGLRPEPVDEALLAQSVAEMVL